MRAPAQHEVAFLAAGALLVFAEQLLCRCFKQERSTGDRARIKPFRPRQAVLKVAGAGPIYLEPFEHVPLFERPLGRTEAVRRKA